VVAFEIFQLGDVFANPFARHFWGAFFVEVFLQYFHQPTFVGGRKLLVSRGTLDVYRLGHGAPLSGPPSYYPAGPAIKRVRP
jgi:hypothetical protein